MWEYEQYAKLIEKILQEGDKRKTRAGETYSIFGETITIDTSIEFPLLRGRKLFYKPVLGELSAFLHCPNNVKDFQSKGCNYWNEWGSKDQIELFRDGGRNYGAGAITLDYGNKWVDFNGTNQLENLIQSLKIDPTGRRHIITGWDPSNLVNLDLPCCHLLYQWYVREGEFLDMIWYQRSVDVMVGLPSDIILAAAWNALIAHQVGLRPGKIKLVLADTHIYTNHIEPTIEYMRNVTNCLDKNYCVLNYELKEDATVLNFSPEMLTINNYDPCPAIKFKLNV